MQSNEKILYVNSISKSFGSRCIIKNISLELGEGEIVSLLGVSGSGKTTLFNIISGIMAPDSGSVIFCDEDITSTPGKISYMLQKDMLFPHKKIIDNVSLPLVIKGMSKKEARKKTLGFFQSFGLDGTEFLYPHMLSGGMRQRAALLRTYLASDRVALLDEPFSALDTLTKASLHHWYLDIISSIGLSTLFITHDIDEALLLSDRIYIISGSPSSIIGEIVIQTPRKQRKGFELTNTFLEYKKQIISSLK